MSPSETDFMAFQIASLSKSFRQVPPAAIPAVLDCILASHCLSPASLFTLLVDSFTIVTQEIVNEDGRFDPDQCNYVESYVGSLCHLLKKSEASEDALQLYIWKCFVPLMRIIHGFDHEIVIQLADTLFHVMGATNTWGVLEETLVPFFLRAIGLSMGMLQNDELAIYKWSRSSNLMDLCIIDDISERKSLSYSFESFPLPICCHSLALILDVALESQRASSTATCLLENDCYARKVGGNVLWDVSIMTFLLLLQTQEHRSCSIIFLLPSICKAFISSCHFLISVRGKDFTFSRNNLFLKIWKCCKTLLCFGPPERRDAYRILSEYFSYFPSIKGCKDINIISPEAEEFDLRSGLEFWDQIKKGLVDKEGLVRKQSLHILKRILQINESSQLSAVSGQVPWEKSSVPHGMTKRAFWADKEAKSLGVGKTSHSVDPSLKTQQIWGAFFLLYEMLEEYGTHLVEAAWNCEITSLLHCFPLCGSMLSIDDMGAHHIRETVGDIIEWLPILWERGLCHENPEVRCLIMQSFLNIEWENHGNLAKSVSLSFVLGPFLQGLNDPVHHKEFGLKGVYTSKTIDGAAKFLQQISSYLNASDCITFLRNLASVAKHQSFGRAGLMGLSECIASAAHGVQIYNTRVLEHHEDSLLETFYVESFQESLCHINRAELLDVVRFVIESSKQHFNPKYRIQVCENVLEAVGLLVCPFDAPLEKIMHFISSMPREFTDFGGSLRGKVQKWLCGHGKKYCGADCCSDISELLNKIYNFPMKFTTRHYFVNAGINFDDGDIDAWGFEANRWTRVLFLVIKEENQLESILKFIAKYGCDIGQPKHQLEYVPMKFLILILSLIHELRIIRERKADCVVKASTKQKQHLLEVEDQWACGDTYSIFEKTAEVFLFILEELVSFMNISCSIFWTSTMIKDTNLPCSIGGKLGGPSQRRLSSSTATAVLEAIMSARAVADISSWCAQFKPFNLLNFAFINLWNFFSKVISFPTCDSQAGAEVCLAAYEALAPVLDTLVSEFSPLALNSIMQNDKCSPPEAEAKPLLDHLVISFIKKTNDLLAVGTLACTRRAVLLNWKWLAVESLLSIPSRALHRGIHLENNNVLYSQETLRWILDDLIDSLENAGEDAVLPMLRSIRSAMWLFVSGKLGSGSCFGDDLDVQMMWSLVRSSWILHISCNKRRVAHIAALLSSVVHSSLFSEECMHANDEEPGPLKWFVGKIIEESTKSPRTIRLTALHLTGLWLSSPKTIKYYMNELKLLTLHGSVAFDEDFEAESAENHDARTEIALLAKNLDPELTEAFINTELYARVSVAAMFYKLADMADAVELIGENENYYAALVCGKSFLQELLDCAVNDKDLAKELYKKYSAIHRRKARAWQMICVLSRFVDDDIVQHVVCSLQTCLYRNNLPSVRQYLEIFAIHVYLRFPLLVEEQLVSVLRDYDIRPQALSSYVFIAANVILHATEVLQLRHLDILLPPIVPHLTSHHHSLRGFTQILVYQVLCKLFPELDCNASGTLPLEKRCFGDLKSYLAKNSDCMRLRASMEGYLDAFDPKSSATPAGIFVNHTEELEFECVPTCLMEQVLIFLNNVRNDLRHNMAKDVVDIENEVLGIDGDPNCMEISFNVNKETMPMDMYLDFQKKITLLKHENHKTGIFFLGNTENYRLLSEMEKEGLLLDQVLQSRSTAIESIKASQQQFILVASLVDRIPNLAGLARTCEVFKAAGLAIADANIVHDKQFQLISVTAEKWVPIIEVSPANLKGFLEKKKREGFSILGLEQTANSVPLDKFIFPKKTVLVLGREKGYTRGNNPYSGLLH